MAKKIKITEAQLQEIIKPIIKEQSGTDILPSKNPKYEVSKIRGKDISMNDLPNIDKLNDCAKHLDYYNKYLNRKDAMFLARLFARNYMNMLTEGVIYLAVLHHSPHHYKRKLFISDMYNPQVLGRSMVEDQKHMNNMLKLTNQDEEFKLNFAPIQKKLGLIDKGHPKLYSTYPSYISRIYNTIYFDFAAKQKK